MYRNFYTHRDGKVFRGNSKHRTLGPCKENADRIMAEIASYKANPESAPYFERDFRTIDGTTNRLDIVSVTQAIDNTEVA